MKMVSPANVNNAILTTSNVSENDYADWSSATTYLIEDRVIYVDPSATVTITIASPGVITWAAHNLSDGQVVLFSTTGTLPTGIDAGVAYYIVERSSNTFQISITKNGAPIVTTGSQSGVHTGTASIHLVFESLRNSNINNVPTVSSLHWLLVAATNRWKMFDESVSSRTSNIDTVDVTLDVVGRINSVAMLNMNASEVQVIVTDDIDGVIYDRTENLVSVVGINTWYNWYFTPITRRRNILFSDLPSYANTEINVIITDTGNMAEIGALVIGRVNNVGPTQYGLNVGIIDFSVKQRDSFGNVSVIERGFSRRANLNVWVDNNDVDNIVNILADVRAIPVVYEASDQFGSSLIYGFYRDFDVVVEMPTVSLLDITIEGLT